MQPLLRAQSSPTATVDAALSSGPTTLSDCKELGSQLLRFSCQRRASQTNTRKRAAGEKSRNPPSRCTARPERIHSVADSCAASRQSTHFHVPSCWVQRSARTCESSNTYSEPCRAPRSSGRSLCQGPEIPPPRCYHNSSLSVPAKHGAGALVNSRKTLHMFAVSMEISPTFPAAARVSQPCCSGPALTLVSLSRCSVLRHQQRCSQSLQNLKCTTAY